MQDVHAEIVGLFEKHAKGFDAIEKGLLACVMESLCKATENEWAWDEAKKQFGIYTIRGRVKSSDRLGRKLAAAGAKAKVPLTVGNFTDFIPDLVGTRIVCLHHDDLFPVAQVLSAILKDSNVFEPPPAESGISPLRVRKGLLTLLPIEQFRAAGFEIDPTHKAGYSSIHFVFRLAQGFSRQIDATIRDDYGRVCKALGNKTCFVEIQLRTILEEAWGEVDHIARYESESLESDPDLVSQLTALASYLQAGNHHISLIRETARRKRETQP